MQLVYSVAPIFRHWLKSTSMKLHNVQAGHFLKSGSGGHSSHNMKRCSFPILSSNLATSRQPVLQMEAQLQSSLSEIDKASRTPRAFQTGEFCCANRASALPPLQGRVHSLPSCARRSIKHLSASVIVAQEIRAARKLPGMVVEASCSVIHVHHLWIPLSSDMGRNKWLPTGSTSTFSCYNKNG